MKGYWVVRGHILDSVEYKKYIELAGSAIKKHSGTFLSRGGKQDEKEGSGYERTVIIEFNSFNEAISCYNSDEYQSALEFVKSSAQRLVVITEGVD